MPCGTYGCHPIPSSYIEIFLAGCPFFAQLPNGKTPRLFSKFSLLSDTNENFNLKSFDSHPLTPRLFYSNKEPTFQTLLYNRLDEMPGMSID